MPLEMRMENVALEDVDRVNLLLQQNWEPFAVYKGQVWFRSQYHNEEREERSSTRHENWMGNEPDVADMVVEE